jgi:hypothetical protein
MYLYFYVICKKSSTLKTMIHSEKVDLSIKFNGSYYLFRWILKKYKNVFDLQKMHEAWKKDDTISINNYK